MGVFKSVVVKLGNMRKEADFVICPPSGGEPDQVIIQSDKRIAVIDLNTGNGRLSDGKGGHPGFHKLSPSLGAMKITVPKELCDEIRQKRDAIPVRSDGSVVILG